MTDPSLERRQNHDGGVTPAPQKGVAREGEVRRIHVQKAETGEAALQEPGPQKVEAVVNQAAIEAGHVALGSPFDDLDREPVAEGVSGQSAITAAEGQDWGRQREAGLDDRLGAKRIAHVDEGRERGGLVAGDAVDETGDLQGLGRAIVVPVPDPGVRLHEPCGGLQQAVGTQGAGVGRPAAASRLNGEGPERGFVGRGEFAGVRIQQAPPSPGAPKIHEDVGRGVLEQDGVSAPAGHEGVGADGADAGRPVGLVRLVERVQAGTKAVRKGAKVFAGHRRAQVRGASRYDVQSRRQAGQVEAFVGFRRVAMGVEPEPDGPAIFFHQGGGDDGGIQPAGHLRGERCGKPRQSSHGLVHRLAEPGGGLLDAGPGREAAPGRQSRGPDFYERGVQREGLDGSGRKRDGAVEDQGGAGRKGISQGEIEAREVDHPARATGVQEPGEGGGSREQQAILRPGDAFQRAGRVAQEGRRAASRAELDADVSTPEAGDELALIGPGVVRGAGRERRGAPIEDVAHELPVRNRRHPGGAGAACGQPGAGTEFGDGQMVRAGEAGEPARQADLVRCFLFAVEGADQEIVAHGQVVMMGV